MDLISVFVAAIGGFGFGAFYYSVLAKHWMEAAGVTPEQTRSAGFTVYLTAFIAMLLVAGMMRHVFASSGIDTFGAGLLAGLGTGLFLAAPWLCVNYTFAFRTKKLIVIDGGYSTLGSGVIGAILGAL